MVSCWLPRGVCEGFSEADAAAVGSSVAHRLRRIAAMAVLIKALDDNQKRNMMMLARTAGLEMLVASK